jgi:hypothetical protein
MRPIKVVVALVLGLIISAVFLAIFTHLFDNHERVGHFDIYTNPKVPDSSVHSALYYRRRRLTERLNGYHVDPNNPDRILFSSDDDGREGPCGSFLYDGRVAQLTRLRRWPYAVGSWSPDSRFILIDRTTVRELVTGKEIDLTESISKDDGSRVELNLLQWSPDSQRLAAEIGVSPDKQGWDRDLVEITMEPLSVKYVATIRNSSLVWTDQQFRWTDGELQVAVPTTPERTVIVKSPDAFGWVLSPPSVPAAPQIHEHDCTAVEPGGH